MLNLHPGKFIVIAPVRWTVLILSRGRAACKRGWFGMLTQRMQPIHLSRLPPPGSG